MAVTFVRTIMALLFFVIQIVFAYFLSIAIDANEIVFVFFSLFCLYFILKIIKESRSISFTLPWIIVFLMFPIPGFLLYCIVKINIKFSKIIKRIIIKENDSKKYLIQDETIKNEFEENSTLKYISDFAKFTVTTNNNVEYYPLGEIGYEEILNELRKAEKFIFMEYFIYNEGKMWNSILEILEQKVKDGVEVRVMYDDLGCINTLKSNYYKVLESKGIKCVVFNKIKPFAGVILNNRDHRKILVIDGKVAFSGGINIADEYININSKYGHWKDNAIKVSGDAVWNYTVMFLTLWNSFKEEDQDYNVYKYDNNDKNINNGYVVPYGNNPLIGEIVGEDIYLNLINNANKYIFICTPYLILDTDMINSLILAAKRGVDVRIVIPGIPDKKMVYTVSESYMAPLINGGVKVYKYTPGFVHAKVLVTDDIKATVGTINLDYRSLYLHFECGCYFEKVDAIKDIKNDMVELISNSREITKKDVHVGYFKSFIQSLLRLFSPML